MNLIDEITKILDSGKGENIFIGKRVDYLSGNVVICTAMAQKHADFLAEEICKFLKSNNIKFIKDCNKQTAWFIIDAGSVIVHIMSDENRERYKIEELTEVE